MTAKPASAATPFTLQPRYGDVPAELARRAQWVCWRWKWAKNDWTKIPLNPATGHLASHADPDTWDTFEAAIKGAATHDANGVGYVFRADDPYSGIDLDDCVSDNMIAGWAQEIIRLSDSYAEYSPSGTGVKVIVKAVLPGRGRKLPEIEMYDRLRFFTITGHRLPDTTASIGEAQQFTTDLYRRYWPDDSETAVVTQLRPRSSPGVDDTTILDRAGRATNGTKFLALYNGDRSGYVSHSEADLALCSMIAFWVGPDHDRIDRIYRTSSLYRTKWERAGYRESTLTIACDRAEYYEPSGKDGATIDFAGIITAANPDADTTPDERYVERVYDLLAERIEPPAWFIDGVMMEQTIGMIVGPAKTYKSFIEQELHIALASGSPAFEMFNVAEPRVCLYVQEESSRWGWRRRFEQLLTGRGMHAGVIRDTLFTITNRHVELDNEESMRRFMDAAMREYEPAVVTFDTLREHHSRDENSSTEMRDVLRVMKRLRDEFGTVVRVVHHNNKNPLYDNPGDSVRGSSAIWGAMDGALFVSKTDNDKVSLVSPYLKEGGQAEPFLVSLQTEGDGIKVVAFDKPEKGLIEPTRIVVWARERGDWWPIDTAIKEFAPVRENTIRAQVRGLVAANRLIERVQNRSRGRKLYAYPEVDNDTPDF